MFQLHTSVQNCYWRGVTKDLRDITEKENTKRKKKHTKMERNEKYEIKIIYWCPHHKSW
jgi:hypothetical protein